MRRSLLLLGDFAASRAGNRSIAEELAPLLAGRGWTVSTAARAASPLPKLAEMLATVWRRRRRYAVASVDLYSGRAFLWADLLTRLLARLGKPIVVVLHGGALPAYAERHPRRFARLLDRADRVVAPSSYLARAFGDRRDDIRVVPNGLPVGEYAFRLRDRPAPDLVWLRAFKELYRPRLAVETIGALDRAGVAAALTMIGPDRGDGSLERARHRARELGVAEAVRFHGGVPKAAVPRHLAAHDLFLNTSAVDNAPVTLVEALASGLPVISTPVGGIPDLVRDGETALLAGGDRDGDGAAALAAAVRRLLDEPGLAGRLSAAGRRLAESMDWERVVPLWEALYGELIEGTVRR